jgi:hypothetical protein
LAFPDSSNMLRQFSLFFLSFRHSSDILPTFFLFILFVQHYSPILPIHPILPILFLFILFLRRSSYSSCSPTFSLAILFFQHFSYSHDVLRLPRHCHDSLGILAISSTLPLPPANLYCVGTGQCRGNFIHYDHLVVRFPATFCSILYLLRFPRRVSPTARPTSVDGRGIDLEPSNFGTCFPAFVSRPDAPKSVPFDRCVPELPERRCPLCIAFRARHGS